MSLLEVETLSTLDSVYSIDVEEIVKGKIRQDEERSLKSFGAVGDGVADDTAFIQAAVDSGVPLYGSDGDYVLTSPISITKPVYLRGSGRDCRFIHRGDYGDTFSIKDPANLAVINGVTLMDFRIEQDTSIPVTQGAQLRVGACRDVWIRGVYIRNGWLGFVNEGSDQMHIDGLYVLFDNTNGGNISGRRFCVNNPTANTGKTAHSGDVFYVNCNFRCGSSVAVGHGFEMTAGDGIWLCNSHIGNCATSTIRINANSATKCTGLLVDNCWIDLGTGAGIRIEGSTPAINGNHYFRNCKLLGGGTSTHGMDIDGAATRIRVENCEISDYLNHGIWTRPTHTGEIVVDGTIIRDCSQAGAGSSNGFNFQGTGNTYFTNNKVLGNLYAQHVSILGSKTIAVLDDNVLVGSFTGSARMSQLAGTQISQKNNHGYNPTGNFSVTPTVTTWTYTNDRGYPVQLFVSGGTVTQISKNGVSLGLTSGAFTVGPLETLTILSSVVPTVRAFGT